MFGRRTTTTATPDPRVASILDAITTRAALAREDRALRGELRPTITTYPVYPIDERRETR